MTTNPTENACHDARRVLIAFNPTAGAKSRIELVSRLVGDLSERGFEPERVESLAALEEETHRWLERGALRAVVAAGGDGTVAEVANRTPPGTPIAVFPLGTENLLARYLGIGRSVEAVTALIARGETVRLDAGRAGHRLFALMVGVGFDAEVVRLIHSGRNGNIRKWSYAGPIWRAMREYRFPRLRVQYAMEVGSGNGAPSASWIWSEPNDCRWAFVFNLPCYGGGLPIAPSADGSDGQLDVCTFERGGVWAGLRYLSAVVFGSHDRMAECCMQKCRRVRIESDEPVPFEIDGDPGGMLPVEIEVVPQRLSVLTPAGFPSRMGRGSASVAQEVCPSATS